MLMSPLIYLTTVLIAIKKWVTLRTLPCDTPISGEMMTYSDMELPIPRKFWISRGSFPLIPKSWISLRIRCLQLVSYAFSRSKNTESKYFFFTKAS